MAVILPYTLQMIKKSNNRIVFLYFVYVLYSCYYFADMQTSANTVVKQVSPRTSVHLLLIALILVLGSYFVIKHRIFVKDSFNNMLLVFFSWATVVDFFNGVPVWSVATHVGLLVLFFLMYYFVSQYCDREEVYQRLIVIETVLWIITTFYAVKAYLNYRSFYGGMSGTPVLNMAYNMLVFLPVLVQIGKPRLRGIAIIITVLYIIISLKRGAIITLAVMAVSYWLVAIKNGDSIHIKRNHLIIILLSIIGFVLMVYEINNSTGGALFERFSYESLKYGSNRNTIYSSAVSEIKQRSFFSLLIGTGSGSTSVLIGSGAHNEVLEIVISYGFIGVIMYFSMIIKGILQYYELKRCTTNKRMLGVYAMSLCYIVSVGVFGSALFSHMSFHIMVSLGISVAFIHSGLYRTKHEGDQI